MNNDALAELYIELAMKYEEENYVECGFKAATETRRKIVDKIKAGSLSKKEIHALEPIFSFSKLNINDYFTAKKRFIFF